MINDTSEPQSAVLGLFDPTRTQRLAATGRGVLRYGLVALLLLWGSFKFAAFEAEGTAPWSNTARSCAGYTRCWACGERPR